MDLGNGRVSGFQPGYATVDQLNYGWRHSNITYIMPCLALGHIYDIDISSSD